MPTYTTLSLGDSYTIGEQVPLHESFPYQLNQLLRASTKNGEVWLAPEILAKTGWTTDELAAAIKQHQFLSSYDVVTLLIGVNNQYRGRTVENFEEEFVPILKQAIQFAAGMASHVFVLSIPDWGVTPFARGKEIDLIAKQIDGYNEVCQKQATANGCHFIDITTSQREDNHLDGFLAADGLHPSGKEYAKWAKALGKSIVTK